MQGGGGQAYAVFWRLAFDYDSVVCDFQVIAERSYGDSRHSVERMVFGTEVEK